MVCKAAPKYIENYIVVPKRLLKIHNKVHMYFEVMYVCGLGFLTSIADVSGYQTAVYIPNKKSTTLLDHINALIRKYKHAGYQITQITTNPEFKPVLEEMNKSSDYIDIDVDYVATQGHVSLAEHNYCTMKVCIRSNLYSLSFPMLPHAMLKVLVVHQATKLNYFISKTGLQFSPCTMLKEYKLEYNEHCHILFGTFVQPPHEPYPYNTIAPRSLDELY